MIWTVVIDLGLAKQVAHWPTARRKRLAEVIEVLRTLGPAAFIFVPQYAGSVDWSAVESPILRMGFAYFSEASYRLGMEIRPHRTVVLRELEHFAKPSWL